MKERGVMILGAFYLLVGVLFIISPFTNITGFSIANNLIFSIGFYYYFGIIMLLVGALLITYSINLSRRDLVTLTERAEEEIRKHIGEERYERLSEKDRTAYLKSYIRHVKNEQRANAYDERSSSTYVVIRTESFMKAIAGHEQEIQRAIEKLERGAGRTEKLKHLPSSTIRTSRGGRIFYDKVGSDIILTDYSPDHKYSRHGH